MSRLQLYLIFLAFELMCVRASAADRIAVIATGGGDADKLAPLVEASLQTSGLQLVERARLNAVVNEQQIDATLTAAGTNARVKLGQLLKADYLVFIRSPEQPKPHLEMIACETTQGIRLANAALPRGDVDAETTAITAVLNAAIAKAKRSSLTIVAVAPWSSDDFSLRFDYRRGAFQQIVQQSLQARPDLVLVEFAEAKALATELAVGGGGTLHRQRPLILDGRMKHSSMEPNAQVTVGLTLSRGAENLGTWTSGQVDPQKAADLLPAAADELVNKAMGGNLPAPPSMQADELAARGRDLVKFGHSDDAYDLFEAALLLKPEDARLHGDAFRALGERVNAEVTPIRNAADSYEDQMRVMQDYAHANTDRLLGGLADMEFYFTHTSVSLTTAEWDFASGRYFLSLSPPQEVRDANYRGLKFKFDHQIKDDYAWICIQMIQCENEFRQGPSFAPRETADFVARMADIWVKGKLQWNAVAVFQAATLAWHPRPDAPEVQTMLASLEHSLNSEARNAVDPIRARLAEIAQRESSTTQVATSQGSIKPASHSRRPTSEPTYAPTAAGTATLRNIPLPFDGDQWAWAGSDADVFFGPIDLPPANLPSSQINRGCYIRADGSSRKLPRFAMGSGPVFDGQNLWMVGSENGETAVYAYDTRTDHLSFAGVNQGVPPDLIGTAWIAAVAQGKVCICASIGGEVPSRTWLAMAEIGQDSMPTCKIFLECKERNTHTRDPSLSVAVVPGEMFMLPGPPGAGEKATPRIYLRRRGGRTAIIDPQTLATSLGKRERFDSNGDLSLHNITLWHDKLFYGMRVWDPRDDTDKSIGVPAGMNPKATVVSTIHNDTFYLLNGDNLFAGMPGAKLARVEVNLPRGFDPRIVWMNQFVFTNALGLVAQGHYQLRLDDPPASSGQTAAQDYVNWIRQRVAAAPDESGYWALADYLKDRGDREVWIAAMDNVFKYSDRSLPMYQQEVIFAHDLMSRGDYQRARKYADDAAQSGAAWAMECSAFVAEGLNDWPRAEQIIKEASEAYGHFTGWYAWCLRTAHGDLAAARAEAARAAADCQADPDAEKLSNAAMYYLMSGDQAKAIPLIKRMLAEKHDVWAALQIGLFAAADGDVNTRDAALANTGDVLSSGEWRMQLLADAISGAFKNNLTLSPEVVTRIADAPSDNLLKDDLAHVYYFSARYLLLRGEKDRAIDYLKRAAGLCSFASSRTLAAEMLRSFGVEPPKSGQIN